MHSYTCVHHERTVSGGKLHIPYSLPCTCGQLHTFPSEPRFQCEVHPCLSRSQRAHRQRGGCFKVWGEKEWTFLVHRLGNNNSNKLNFGFRVQHWRKQSQQPCVVARTVGTLKGTCSWKWEVSWFLSTTTCNDRFEKLFSHPGQRVMHAATQMCTHRRGTWQRNGWKKVAVSED